MKTKVTKRWLSAFLAAIMVFSSAAYDFPAVVNAAPADYEAAETSGSEDGLIYVDEAEDDSAAYSDEIAGDDLLGEAEEDVAHAGANEYGLCDNIQDGVILHCFNWKYTDIEAELPNIAEAGFTSVQTSPAQRDDGGERYIWYMLYQPQSFAIATNPLGTKEELKSLCEKADQYGIKVIVDVVANHMRGDGADVDSNMSRNSHSDYWHQNNLGSGGTVGDFGQKINWADRYQVHQGRIGMEDLNSEHSEVQRIVAAYIDELKSIGVDGIRWDAAKHIGLPSESCQFWPAVTSQGLWHYGEILEGPDDRESGNEGLMKEYTKYMSVTDNGYGNQLTGNFRDGKVTSANGKWINKNAGITANKLVYWGESHDTYSNHDDGKDGGWTKNINQNVIDRGYAIAASRKDATALYFSRPFEKEKERISAGAKGSTHFTSKEVAAVNHLHNAAVGEKEYYVGDTNNNVAAVCRESGAVVVLGSGGNRDVTVSNGGGTVKPGTYTDEVSGSTWNVTSTTMSGRVGETGIAVFYDAGPIVTTPKPTISKEGGNFNDTLTLTIGLSNAPSGTYKIGNDPVQNYTGSKTFTIGSDMAFGDSIIITLTAIAADGTKTEKSYTFKKVEQTGNVVYLSLPSGWGKSVYCYAYVPGTTPAVNNAGWPGVAMTLEEATGYYKYEIPDNMESPKVILHDDAGHRTSEEGEPEKVIDGSWLYKDGSWQEYSPTPPRPTQGTVTVKHEDAQGKTVAAPQTLTGDVGTSYTTSAATVAGYKLKTTPSNASGKYTEASITVTYVYESAVPNALDVTSSLADGATFKEETTRITLTAQNATSATYTVDGGPVKTFTNSASVVIGQGKIADSDVTVKVTATDGTDTVKKTFTYKKEFSGKVANETVNDIPRAALGQSEETVRSGAGGTLASQYSTNKAGVGVEKTISVDGDISDWNSSMLIAQGAANDDPRVYRPNSMYEVPVDLYALYGAYDDNNVYLMWEMTNVQDVVSPLDNYPLTQGTMYMNMNVPFHIAIDTGKSDVIGKNGALQGGGTLWDSGITIGSSFNRLVLISTNGANGPFVYAGDASGVNPVEIFSKAGGGKAQAAKSGIQFNYGQGIISSSVRGIDKGHGEHNGRVVGDIYNESAAWCDFNVKGHDSVAMDYFYEMSIPYAELGITKNDVKQNGIGVLLIATMGKSAMDCLPYDGAMNDNADKDDAVGSNENNSFEKSDEDFITCSFARIGNEGGHIIDPPPTTDLTVNFGADKSSPQLNTTSLTLEAIASGGKSAYTYEFFVDGASVQGKSSKATYTWSPSAGNHTIKVTVTDSDGKTVSSQKAYAIEGEVEPPNNPVAINSFTASPAGSVYTGNSVSLTAAASGGTGTLKYQFTAQLGNGAESVIQSYGTSRTATWTPQTAGSYTLKVSVMDDGNKSATKTIAGYEVIDNVSLDIRVFFADTTKKYVYDGTEKKPAVVVMDGTKTLTRNTDYTVSYENNINAGDAQASNPPTVIITGKNTYSGKISERLTFTINKEEGSLPPGEPDGAMNAQAGLVSDVRLDSGWEWLDSDKNKEIPSGESIEVTAVYNGADKNNYVNTTKKVTLTGIKCQHSDTTQHVEKIITPATCKENGRKEVICMVCRGKVRDGEEIPKLGHIGGTATCTKAAVCARCGESYGFLDSNNHVDTTVYRQQKANCEHSGYTGDIICTACGTTVLQGRPIPQTSHNWDGGVVTKAATATADGIRTFTCTVCQKTRTEAIPKTGGGGQGSPTDPISGGTVKAGDSVTDSATKATYKVTRADSTGKTVEFVAPTEASKTVKIPNTIVIKGTTYQVTSVADNAFKNNKVLQKVTMGSNISTIGKNAFSGCSMLTKVTLSKNATTIGNNAFYKCTSLTSITIPAKVGKIGSKAFYGCKKLKKITIKTTKLTAKKVGSKAFKGIAPKATIKVPKKKLASYKKMLKAKGVGSKAKIKK